MDKNKKKFILNSVQMKHLKGLIGEKVVGYNLKNIKQDILVSLKKDGNWKDEFNIRSGLGDSILGIYKHNWTALKNPVATYGFSLNLKEIGKRLSLSFKNNCVFFFPKKVIIKHERLKNSLIMKRPLFKRKDETLPDYSFLIYKIGNKKQKVSFKITIYNLKDKRKKKTLIFEKEIPIVEDVKGVIIEVKTGSGTLSKSRQIARDNKEDYFYFVTKLDINLKINPNINVKVQQH